MNLDLSERRGDDYLSPHKKYNHVIEKIETIGAEAIVQGYPLKCKCSSLLVGPNLFSSMIDSVAKQIGRLKLKTIASNLLLGENQQYRDLLEDVSINSFRANYNIRTCFFVSNYENTKTDYYSVVDGQEEFLYRKLVRIGKEQFKMFQDVPSGIPAFSEVLDKYTDAYTPLQLNLTEEDEEDNDTWRFYVVLKCSTGDEVFDLRYFFCGILPEEQINELGDRLFYGISSYETIVEQINLLKAKISALADNADRNGGLKAVIIAKNINNAEKAARNLMRRSRLGRNDSDDARPVIVEGIVEPRRPNRSRRFSIVAIYPMAKRTNVDRLVRLAYYDYFIYQILNKFSTKRKGEKDHNYCLFIPEFPNTSRVSSGIIVSAARRFSAAVLRGIQVLVTQSFKPIYIASMIESNKLGNLKSAVGAIMSRNGSHNIGSHVLSSLSHLIGTMPDDRILYQYIQQRMGYIANVTTGFPGWTTSTMFVGNMMRTFFSQHHLLEYIADGEDLHAYCFRDPNGISCTDDEQSGTIKLCIRRVDRSARAADIKPGDGILHGVGSGKKTGLARETIKVNHFLFNHLYNRKKPLPLDKDVSLAIPGGVIGQHAFFTILENIIRNAAKHGWTARTMEEKVRLKNLEIHISFEVSKDDDSIEFTIWDNVSDVFSPLFMKDESGIDEYRFRKFLEALSQVSDQNSPKLKQSDETRKQWIEKRLNGCLDWNDLDGESFRRCWNRAAESDLFDSFVRTELNKYEMKELRLIDFKSCVPLHMQQEMLLAQPLIDESGELLQENWGMAEMKISAGYLRSFSVEQIGGLKPIKQGEYMIRAIAVKKQFSCPMNLSGDSQCSHTCKDPANECNKFTCRKRKGYHLGYRFKIRKNREMLIVLNETPRIGGPSLVARIRRLASALKRNGVYFARMENKNLLWIDEHDPQMDEAVVKDFNFEYVIFPSEEDAEKSVIQLMPAEEQWSWMSCFPFRLLVGKKEAARQAGSGFFDGKDDAKGSSRLPARIAYDELLGVLSGITDDSDLAETVFSLKNIVYRDWLRFLKAPCLEEDEPLSLYVRTCDDEKTGEYLFPDHDLYQFVFQNCFGMESSRGFSKNESGSGSSGAIEHPGKTRGNVPGNGFPSIKHLLRCNPSIIKKQEDLSDSVGGETQQIVSNIVSASRLKPNDEKRIRDITDAMEKAYHICDFLLRRKNISCSTLPDAFVGENGQKKRSECDNLLQAYPGLKESIVFLSDADERRGCTVKYQRHLVATSKSPDTFYAEQLSGTQSYFNAFRNVLSSPDPGNAGFFVRLAENALLRILVIDERVSKFLNEHPHMQTVFYNMNIFAMDFSKTNKKDFHKSIGIEEGVFDIDIARLPLFLRFDKAFGRKNAASALLGGEWQRNTPLWDILIIHQGVIDKWFSRHSKSDVQKIMNNLQKKVMYPVVTSGRGRPDNIPESVKVLPFSTIESTLFNNCPEKMVLTATIMNLLPAANY